MQQVAHNNRNNRWRNDRLSGDHNPPPRKRVTSCVVWTPCRNYSSKRRLEDTHLAVERPKRPLSRCLRRSFWNDLRDTSLFRLDLSGNLSFCKKKLRLPDKTRRSFLTYVTRFLLCVPFPSLENTMRVCQPLKYTRRDNFFNCCVYNLKNLYNFLTVVHRIKKNWNRTTGLFTGNRLIHSPTLPNAYDFLSS